MWRGLRCERLKLGDKVDTLSQIVRATRDEAEEALARPVAQSAQSYANGRAQEGDPFANWERIRSDWRNVRERLEFMIENISRARVRGKYSKLPRYNYRRVINALQTDGEMTSKVCNELLRMDTLFNTIRFRPKGVTNEELSKFEDAYNLVDRFLPRLPEPPSSPQPEPTLSPAPEMGTHQAA